MQNIVQMLFVKNDHMVNLFWASNALFEGLNGVDEGLNALFEAWNGTNEGWNALFEAWNGSFEA